MNAGASDIHIMVGEMRDYETISAAISAAETGHLVISTLHTTGAAQIRDNKIHQINSTIQSNMGMHTLGADLKRLMGSFTITRETALEYATNPKEITMF